MHTAAVTGIDTAELAELLRGELIRPEDDGYDEARAVHNAAIDKHPAFVARCVDVADVIAVVNFARDNKLSIAVRCGGHSPAGFATSDGGAVIDLSRMKGIKIDPEAKTATVEGGCTWGDVDHATHAFGLATPGGVVSTTGVGGLTLGGGLGYLTRSCGLSIDNMIEADVVLADGSFVTASPDRNEDLFWALRGGGGNFGVVTSLTFRLHPAAVHIGGPMLWPLDRAVEAMTMYREVLEDAPDELTGVFAFLVVPPGPPFPEEIHLKNMCGIIWVWRGAPEEADEKLAPARALDPVFELVGPIPHPVLQSMFDGISGSGNQNYWRGDFVKELTDEAIAAYAEAGAGVPTISSGVHLYPIDGVAGRVGAGETAWGYRNARWAGVIFGADPDPGSLEELRAWVVDSWETLHPFSAGGSYVNFMVDEGQERVKAAYGDNYARLTEVKKRYDPENLFNLNQNIHPAG